MKKFRNIAIAMMVFILATGCGAANAAPKETVEQTTAEQTEQVVEEAVEQTTAEQTAEVTTEEQVTEATTEEQATEATTEEQATEATTEEQVTEATTETQVTEAPNAEAPAGKIVLSYEDNYTVEAEFDGTNLVIENYVTSNDVKKEMDLIYSNTKMEYVSENTADVDYGGFMIMFPDYKIIVSGEMPETNRKWLEDRFGSVRLIQER